MPRAAPLRLAPRGATWRTSPSGCSSAGPMRSDQLGETLLPKRIALPVFASDAHVLGRLRHRRRSSSSWRSAGTALLHLTWYAAAASSSSCSTVVAAYRQNVHAYPSGGGDYEVANTNLGPQVRPRRRGGAARRLRPDRRGVDVRRRREPRVHAGLRLDGQPRVGTTLVVVAIIVLLNLRGIRESGVAFAIPTYAFMFGIIGMVALGVWSAGVRRRPRRRRRRSTAIKPELRTLAGLALVFLAPARLRLRLYGADRRRGHLQRRARLPQAEVQERRDHAGAHGRHRPDDVRRRDVPGDPPAACTRRREQRRPTSIGCPTASARTPSSRRSARRSSAATTTCRSTSCSSSTALILVLAANTAFNGFPVLASILAQDRYMPRQMHTRGDRLVFSNGILLLAGVRRPADLGVPGDSPPS